MGDAHHDLITGTIFLLGVITVILSVYACCRFHVFRGGLNKAACKLSGAISWQLMGEAVIGLGTLVFATAEFMGWLEGWNYWFTSALRFTMFIFTAGTTWHLVRTIETLKG